MASPPKDRCRMVTKQHERCSRKAVPGGMGFCWQHVPVKAKDREKWKLGIEGASLVVASAELLIKIVELAVQYLPEMFGPGDEQTNAKREIASHFPPSWPALPGNYAPGKRVDWKTLLELLQDAESAADDPASSNYINLERRFDGWFEHMNEYHKARLLEAVSKAAATEDRVD
jgi:hypothetical protein